MKKPLLLIVTVLSVPAGAQTLQSLRTPAGQLAFQMSEYKRRAGVGGASAAATQFAILHALMGWQGGTNPGYAFYETKDRNLLRSLGIAVEPIGDRAQRAIVETRLAEIRGLRNFGGAKTTAQTEAKREAAMVAQHEALISRYAGHIKYTALMPDAKSDPALAASVRQDAAVRGLVRPLQDMAAADSDPAFARAVDRFNAQAGKLGKGYKVFYEVGQPRRPALEAALRVYGAERAEALRMARAANKPGETQVPFTGELEALWKKEAGRFDGAGGGSQPRVDTRDDGALSQITFNAAEPREAVVVNAPREDRAVTTGRPGGANKKPGVFGLLGEMLKALGRTLSRVARALFS